MNWKMIPFVRSAISWNTYYRIIKPSNWTKTEPYQQMDYARVLLQLLNANWVFYLSRKSDISVSPSIFPHLVEHSEVSIRMPIITQPNNYGSIKTNRIHYTCNANYIQSFVSCTEKLYNVGLGIFFTFSTIVEVL